MERDGEVNGAVYTRSSSSLAFLKKYALHKSFRTVKCVCAFFFGWAIFLFEYNSFITRSTLFLHEIRQGGGTDPDRIWSLRSI